MAMTKDLEESVKKNNIIGPFKRVHIIDSPIQVQNCVKVSSNLKDYLHICRIKHADEIFLSPFHSSF